ncbi:single-stranded-DNA-specific exonuclease RecJ [Candidatus Parcubacteria bacterium]|nr:MAG: single-stranded-DNA-specific exonuclease RecJ [Candidatus Parcubacteria bacterium]
MRQWILREKIPNDVSGELGDLPEMVKSLLFHRGIKTSQEAKKFLAPSYDDDTGDPLEILNMEKASLRIIKAIKDNEKIVVFGDYDADGVCASVIFHDFFKRIGFENFHVHIPDRYLDGYGLTNKAVDEFKEIGASLIITLDCGVTNSEEVDRANSRGIDVVIIDHHIVPEEPPKAYAIVDLKQDGEKYPTKFLCGAGIAFKTVCALIKLGNFNIIPGWEKWLLDVVAVATVADMVPMTQENRVFVHYGLKVLRKTRRPGLLAFYRRLNLGPGTIGEDDLGFMIAPRLNVAGRMEHATVSFNLLTTQSPQEADWISGRLEVMNNDRKGLVEKIINKIEEEVTDLPDINRIITAGDESWSPGVLGLAANRILEKYNCPVFLWGKGGGNLKGSCRSDGSIDLVRFMRLMPEGIFEDLGGHSFSAGFTLAGNDTDRLKEEIGKLYAKLPKTAVEKVIKVEREMLMDEVDQTFYSLIESFQPFGAENPKPVFSFRGVKIFNVKKFGNGGIHLQFDFKKKDGSVISAVGFFMSREDFFDYTSGQIIDLAASLEKSYFKSKPELRLRIVDARKAA